MTVKQIGFIGLGAMGQVMARHLLEGGHALTVWARRAESTAALAQAGASVAASPADLAAACEVVFLCVTDTAAVEEVVFGSDGIASAAPAARLLVDHSTIHPLSTRTFAERLVAANGTRWIDAPVSGGVVGVENRRLVVMAGGAAEDIARINDLLGLYSQRVTHLGACGAGQASKVANQMMIGGTVGVVAEALNYAANFGVEASVLPDALAGGWADSAVLQHHARHMTAADYREEVNAKIMIKDLDIATDLGRATGSPMPVTALVQQLYRQLIASGDADKGQSGIMWLYRQTPTP